MRRSTLFPLAALALTIPILALTPATAAGSGEIAVAGDTLLVTVTDDADHNVAVTSLTPTEYRMHEAGEGTTLPAPTGPECTDITAPPYSGINVDCTAADAIGSVLVTLGSGDDEFVESWFTSTDADGVAYDVEGGDGDDRLRGGLADDSLDGGPGADSIDGGGGDDTITAQDGTVDTITCGVGDDLVTADAADAVDADCEQVDRAAEPVAVGGVTYTGETTDTARVVRFPELRGMSQLAATNRLTVVGINAELGRTAMVYGSAAQLAHGVHPADGQWHEGDVLAMRYRVGSHVYTAPGRPVTSGAATKVPVTLTIYGGQHRDSCVQDARDNAGLSWDDYQALLTARGCRLDDVDVRFPSSTTTRGERDLNSGDRCEAARAAAAAGAHRLDETLLVPADLDHQDLRLVTLESAQGASFQTDFTLQAAAAPEYFRVFVGDRTVSQIPDHATVYVDASGVGDPGGTRTAITGTAGQAPGVASFRVVPLHAGTIDIAAVWSDSSGQMICGGTQVKVTGATAGPNVAITTVSGRVWTTDETARHWVRTGSASRPGPAPEQARGFSDWLAQVGQWLHDVLVGIPTPAQQEQANLAAQGTASALQSLQDDDKVQLGHLQVGASSAVGDLAVAVDAASSDLPFLLATGDQVVSVSGIVAQGGGNLASGEVKLITNDGGSLTGAYLPGAGIVAQGGGNIVAQGGGNIVAQGGGNIVAQGAGNIISFNGAGIVAQGGGNAIGAGPGLVQAGIVAQGGGN